MHCCHIKIFEFVFYCFYYLTSIFFVLFLWDKRFKKNFYQILPIFFYHFLWAFWHKNNVLFMEIIYQWKSIIRWKRRKKLLTDFIRSYFPNCFLVLSANIYQLHLFTGKLSNNCTYNPKRTFSSPYAKKYVCLKPLCVKLSHRFIFVRKLRPNSTFHNCKDN